MSTATIEQLRSENEQLRTLLQDYYVAAQMGKRMEDPSEYEVRQYEELINSLQQQAAPLLGIAEEDQDCDLECECGTTLEWLIKFFGPQEYRDLVV
jgi:hypothetical protein